MCVPIEWLRVIERRDAPTRYVLSAAAYQRLVDAVTPFTSAQGARRTPHSLGFCLTQSSFVSV